MSGRFLLDTNIVIALFAKEIGVQEKFAEASELFVPSIAVGELCYRATKSVRCQENLDRIYRFVSIIAVLDCDLETAYLYGRTKNQLRIRGRPLPENDIWIAALAIQHDLVLVTRDQHFQEIDFLSKVI
jgi:tRNA(fMet)-specific endonuclease VapC